MHQTSMLEDQHPARLGINIHAVITGNRVKCGRTAFEIAVGVIFAGIIQVKMERVVGDFARVRCDVGAVTVC